MRKNSLALIPLAAALFLGACFQHTYHVGAGAPNGEIVYKNWHHHWLFGTIRPELQKELDVEKFCPSGNATIHQEVTFLNGLIDVLIGIIYSPTTVEIRCDNGESTSVELSEEKIVEIVTDPLFLEWVEEAAPERLEETRVALGLRTGGEEVEVAP